MSRLAKSDLLPILRDLATTMPGAKDRDPAALLDGYYQALDDCSVEEIRVAALAAKRESRFFPAPAMLRRYALDHRQQHPREQDDVGRTPHERMLNWAHEGMPAGKPCPCCGSVLEWPEDRRARVNHDLAQHRAAGYPVIGGIA